jgi:precorrin-2 C20-methyltransferase / precorrin-3B C17-methyltransferase
VIALHNPRSKHRPHRLGEAQKVLLETRSADTVVVVGRDVGGPDEQLPVTTRAELDPDTVDMRCLLIIGSSRSRVGAGGVVFTART